MYITKEIPDILTHIIHCATMLYFVFKLGKGFITMVYHQKLENNYLFSILNVCSIIMEICLKSYYLFK